MKILTEYPHFKGQHLNRCEQIERFVVDELVKTPLSDDERESSQSWELMHSSTCKAFMHVLAEKRGVPVELCRIAGALHDYYVIKTGKYGNHAHLGSPLVVDILKKHGGFSDQEITFVEEMVYHHSDKHIYSDDAHVELIKDADVFDCSLYDGTEFYYLTMKPLPVCREYFVRVLNVRKELGMPLPESYRCLEPVHNGPLVQIDRAIGVGSTTLGPTVPMLALWGLATAVEAKNWPVLAVYSDGDKLSWYLPERSLSVKSNGRIPTWTELQSLFAKSVSDVQELEMASRNSNVKTVLSGARKLFASSSGFVTGAVNAIRESAIALRDFHCDPAADEHLEGVVANRLAGMPEIHENLERLRPRSNEAPSRTPGSKWDLTDEQQSVVDNLAQVRALNDLRGAIVDRVAETLVRNSDSGEQVLKAFPSEIFGGESCPPVENSDTPWLAVAWPGFGKYEFLIDEAATKRFESLKNHFRREEESDTSTCGHDHRAPQIIL